MAVSRLSLQVSEVPSMRYQLYYWPTYSGPRRICPARAGGGRRGLYRRGAQRQRHRRDDEDDGDGKGHAAVCAAVPESGKSRDRPHRQHPALSGIAPRAGAEGGGRQAVGAPAAADHHRFRAGSSRHPSSARPLALLRGAEGAGEKAHRRILEIAGAEISGLFRGAAGGQWRRLRHRPPPDLCRSVAVPDRGRAALRLSKAHEGV